MSRASFLTAAAAAGTLVTLVFVGAPAHATPVDRELPAGDTMYALPCDDLTSSIYQVDPASGALTAVGPALETGAPCWVGGYVDPSDGLIYSIDWNAGDDQGNNQISTIDPATGAVSVVSTLHTADDSHPWIMALAQSPDGTVYALENTASFQVPYLYTLDVSSGLLTPIGQTYRDNTNFESRYWAMAWNPNTDELVGYAQSGSGRYTSLDTSTAMATEVSTTAQNFALSIAFDSSGTPWTVNGGNGTLASGSWPDFDAEAANQYQLAFDGDSKWIDAIVIVHTNPVMPNEPASSTPAAELAATGAEVATPIAGGLLALVVGALALVARRTRRSSSLRGQL